MPNRADEYAVTVVQGGDQIINADYIPGPGELHQSESESLAAVGSLIAESTAKAKAARLRFVKVSLQLWPLHLPARKKSQGFPCSGMWFDGTSQRIQHLNVKPHLSACFRAFW